MHLDIVAAHDDLRGRLISTKLTSRETLANVLSYGRMSARRFGNQW